MKRHVDFNELKRLNKEQLKKLSKLAPACHPLYQAVTLLNSNMKIDDWLYMEIMQELDMAILLDILINSKTEDKCIKNSLIIRCDSITNKYYIEYFLKRNIDTTECKDYEAEELCDVLWMAIKTLL